MDVFEAIHNRQSAAKIKADQPVSRDLIEKLLSAAVQAPNHHKVRPWRFVVVSGDSRQNYGEVLATALRKRKPDSTEEAIKVEREKPLRYPATIVVGVDKPSDPKASELENVMAVAAAVENLLLAAQSLGLIGTWRTGKAAEDPEVKAFFGFAPDQHLVGFIHVGYPEKLEPVSRPSFEDRTVWME